MSVVVTIVITLSVVILVTVIGIAVYYASTMTPTSTTTSTMTPMPAVISMWSDTMLEAMGGVESWVIFRRSKSGKQETSKTESKAHKSMVIALVF